MLVDKRRQIAIQRHIGPQRGLLINRYILSDLYSTFFVGAEGFAVAPKLQCHLREHAQVRQRRHGRPSFNREGSTHGGQTELDPEMQLIVVNARLLK